MTVAEKIRKGTEPLSVWRSVQCARQYIKAKVLMAASRAASVEYQFIDGSKLTCRVYW